MPRIVYAIDTADGQFLERIALTKSGKSGTKVQFTFGPHSTAMVWSSAEIAQKNLDAMRVLASVPYHAWKTAPIEITDAPAAKKAAR